MTKEQHIKDLEVIIAASKEHLKDAIEKGETYNAHKIVDDIIGCQRELQKVKTES